MKTLLALVVVLAAQALPQLPNVASHLRRFPTAVASIAAVATSTARPATVTAIRHAAVAAHASRVRNLSLPL